MPTIASHVSIALLTRSSRCRMAVCWKDAARSALIDSGKAALFFSFSSRSIKRTWSMVSRLELESNRRDTEGIRQDIRLFTYMTRMCSGSGKRAQRYVAAHSNAFAESDHRLGISATALLALLCLVSKGGALCQGYNPFQRFRRMCASTSCLGRWILDTRKTT